MPASKERQPQERQAYELARLNSIKEYIDFLAFAYSWDVPDQVEDLAQEGRLRVIAELRKNPDCPISHLKVAAKSGIWEYRRRGKSVDGKINEGRRPYRYGVVGLHETIPPARSPLDDLLSQAGSPVRITEEQALSRVLMAELRNQLSAEENLVLTLRLANVSWKQIGAAIFSRYTCPRSIRQGLEEATVTTLTSITAEPPPDQQPIQPQTGTLT